MRIYLVRHGESEANVAGVVNDDPRRPVNLTERGCWQAREAARRLAGIAFDGASASRFPRARQTAGHILAGLGLGLPLVVDARLDERRSGLDGRPVESFNGLVRPDPVNIRPEKGESFLDQMERLRGFLDELALHHPTSTWLAVSHENPILAATALGGRDVQEAARGAIGHCEWCCLDWDSK